MSKYMLYGTCLIESDKTLKDFAKSIIKNVPTDDLVELENKYCEDLDDQEFEDVYMDRVKEILESDLNRTDIDYQELMFKYRNEIGELLFHIENHGADLQNFEISFFGNKAEISFNKLITEAIWFEKFYS